MLKQTFLHKLDLLRFVTVITVAIFVIPILRSISPVIKNDTISQVSPATISQVSAKAILDRLPLSFIPNMGQFDPKVEFMVRSLGGTLLFSPSEVVLNLSGLKPMSKQDNFAPSRILNVKFEDTSPNTLIRGDEKRRGTINYFIGNNPAYWHTNIPTYRSVSYINLYSGINLYYEGQEGKLKSTYFIAPYANPSQINWHYQGASDVQVEAETGDLLISITNGNADEEYILREQAPIAWQIIANKRERVKVDYHLADHDTVGFSLGAYDPAYALIIDPIVLAYSTYLGGYSFDWGEALAVDNDGNVYISGPTTSDDFPTRNAYDQSLALCGTDVFITKIDTTQSADNSLVYSTYLGGSGNCANDNGLGIALDSSGNAYVTGFVQANDFPTVNAYDTTKGNGPSGDDTSNDAFLAKLNPTGNQLLYSTYLGGNGRTDDIGYGIAVDNAGNAYICGVVFSDDFPTKNPYQNSKNGISDAFVAKLDTTQSGEASLIYSSYLGGTGNDTATGIVVDGTGKAYVSGRTNSTNFPTRRAYQNNYGGGASDVFVAEFDLGQIGEASLIYSTFLGGSGDEGSDFYSYAGGVAIDSSGNTYVAGETRSTDFPIKNAYQVNQAGSYDVFVSKLDPTQSGEASLVYSTYLGGIGDDIGNEIAVNSAGNAYIVGSTASSNFPTKYPYQPNYNDGGDTFVTKFATNGATLAFSTYFGGSQSDEAADIVIDNMDRIYITGATSSDNLPMRNAYDSSISNNGDGFVTKFDYISIYLPIIFKSSF